jgi:hypothetical protein
MVRSSDKVLAVAATLLFLTGCAMTGGNSGSIQSYPFLAVEPKWIRDGEAVFYDGRRWYPQDDVEVFVDSEMLLIGDYRGVQVFVAKTDVKPYDRLYTKFDVNKYRYYYSVKKANDPS